MPPSSHPEADRKENFGRKLRKVGTRFPEIAGKVFRCTPSLREARVEPRRGPRAFANAANTASGGRRPRRRGGPTRRSEWGGEAFARFNLGPAPDPVLPVGSTYPSRPGSVSLGRFNLTRDRLHTPCGKLGACSVVGGRWGPPGSTFEFAPDPGSCSSFNLDAPTVCGAPR